MSSGARTMAGSTIGGDGTDRTGRVAVWEAVRSRLAVVLLFLVVAGVAWWLTAVRMSGMDAGPGTAVGTLGWFIGVWTVMMAAMMFPSLAPTAAVYATQASRREPSSWLLFAGGYLLVWSAAGVVAFGLFELGEALFGGELGWHSGGRWLSAGVLALAAAYQLTPIKGACLAMCRNPLRLLGERRRDRWSGALAMGVRSGSWCLGCSWGMMAALFALGVMSMDWMALVAVLVAVEKIGPWPRAARAATATVFAALAVGILAFPRDVPALVVPGSPGAIHTMHTMQQG